MTSLATLQTRLTEAEAALHALNMGERIVSLNITTGAATRQYSYQAADIGKLEGYISRLNDQIANVSATPRKRVLRLYQSGRGY